MLTSTSLRSLLLFERRIVILGYEGRMGVESASECMLRPPYNCLGQNIGAMRH
jgi:hypothetical protein